MSQDRVQDKRRHDFYIVDNEVVFIHGENIGADGIAVYNVMVACANMDGEAEPSIGMIARLVKLSKPTVRKVIAQLITEGLISQRKRPPAPGQLVNESHVYTLLPVVKKLREMREARKEVVKPVDHPQNTASQSHETGVVKQVDYPGSQNDDQGGKAGLPRGSQNNDQGVVKTTTTLKKTQEDLNASHAPVRAPRARSAEQTARAVMAQSRAFRALVKLLSNQDQAYRILQAHPRDWQTDNGDTWVEQCRRWKVWREAQRKPDGTLKYGLGYVYTQIIGGAEAPDDGARKGPITLEELERQANEDIRTARIR